MIIQKNDDITLEWLSTVLGHSVTAFDDEVSTPFMSEVHQLTLTYAPNASHGLPQKLFLKVGTGNHGSAEVDFYTDPASQGLPIPQCYDAQYDPKVGYHILLTDLTLTHDIAPIGFPPSYARHQLAVKSLAQIHARWWGKRTVTPEQVNQFVFAGITAEDLSDFQSFMGDWLPPDRVAVFQNVFAAHDQITAHLLNRPLTLIHSDTHPWNFLYPKADHGQAILVDWESYGTDLGIYDLAYMIGLWWFQSQRDRFEVELVKIYHQTLIEHGVTGYSWEHCWDDYRWCVLRCLIMPIFWWQRGGLPPELWWTRLEKIYLTIHDLDCLALIE